MNNQYPIGPYEVPEQINQIDIHQWIDDISSFPEKLKRISEGLLDTKLSYQYRDQSWDIKTLIHHMADSHLHGYQRTKLILTEDSPVISTFNENQWVLLSDNENNITDSLKIISGIHHSWSTFKVTL